ncbi:hypothetical protein SGRIM128S_07028 [Streptomyces griseomycini]
MPLVPPITMKLVVTGTPGVISRRISRSARRWSLSASDEKRLKSSCCVGLGWEAASRGGRICSQSVYRCDQKAVPQALLSASSVV